MMNQINIFDINIVYEMQYDNPPKAEKSLVNLFFHKIYLLIYSSKQNKTKPKKQNQQNETDILFFGESKNNQLVLNRVIDNLNELNFRKVFNDKDYPLSKSIIYSFRYIPNLISVYFNSDSNKRKLINKYPLEYLFAYGKFILAHKLLNDFCPKLLVLSNDHSPFNRCLLFAAKNLNIKIAYLQHASVTTKFPKLEFDISFLDGQESFEKYGFTSKKNSRVILSGSPRYDDYFVKNKSESKMIGIAINQFDDFEKVRKLCLFLKSNYKDYGILIRPHPNMIDWHRQWFENNNIKYCESSKIKSLEYLKSIDFQIANVSAIHLDAVMLKVNSIMFRLSKEFVEDQYGYLKNSIIAYADNYDELKKIINKGVKIIPKMSYFQANYNTEYKNKSAKFIARYIENLILKRPNQINSALKYYDF